jgi:hypothetical protein
MSVRGNFDCACGKTNSILNSNGIWLVGKESIHEALRLLKHFEKSLYSPGIHINGMHVTSVYESDDGSGEAIWPIRSNQQPDVTFYRRVTEVI